MKQELLNIFLLEFMQLSSGIEMELHDGKVALVCAFLYAFVAGIMCYNTLFID